MIRKRTIEGYLVLTITLFIGSTALAALDEKLYYIPIFFTFFIFLGIVTLIWFKMNEARLIGEDAEKFVRKMLLKLDPASYTILNDLLLPSKGSLDVTQIDHIVVSNYGIFCLETKGHAGWILGRANQEYWTQTIYRYKKSFYNPLRQNYAHMKAIEELLKPYFPNISIVSLVVFPNAKKIELADTDNVGDMLNILDRIDSYETIVFSDVQKKQICDILMKNNILDKRVRKIHNQKIKALINF